MKRLFVIAWLVAGCSSKRDAPAVESTSHTTMPNQFEVGSTIDERYRVVKKLGEVGEYMVFSIEPTSMGDRKLTMIAPKSAQASVALEGAMAVEMKELRTKWIAMEQLPARAEHYAVGELSDAEVRDLLGGVRTLGR